LKERKARSQLSQEVILASKVEMESLGAGSVKKSFLDSEVEAER
jgi:hypothetical protein